MTVLLQRIRDLERRLESERRRRNEERQSRERWHKLAIERAEKLRRLRSDLRRARESRDMWRQRYFDLRWATSDSERRAA